MPVNHEVKSNLAKLLATEDLVVEHRKVETAQFNVHTRVLTLPMWEKASSQVYDMLVGHEVGHALYTPDRDWLLEKKINPSFVNIVEDARIEKLMKRRYAGMSKTFYKGYEELVKEDFFCIKDENLDEMNLADRANLLFKIGNYTQIPIKSDKESEIISMIADAETFDDVLEAAEVLYNYCKESMDTSIDNVQAPQQSTQGGGGSTQDGGEQQENANDNANEESNANDNANEESNANEDAPVGNQPSQKQEGGEEYGDDEPETKTVDSLSNSIKDLINSDAQENVYVEVPKVTLDTVIKSNSTIHDYIDEYWKMYATDDYQYFKWIDNDYSKFKKSAQKEVNYLVKEFECRKAADSYARASTSRTGVLDCTKLHTYKYNEDLFKKVTTFADGKNHGLIFIIDWSGSMSQVMMDTIKQLYNIIWFCRKVNIPFDVYAFTSDWNTFHSHELTPEHYVKKEGLMCVHRDFSLLHLFTSSLKSSAIDIQMRNIYRIANTFKNYPMYNCPPGMQLSGTPLNEALVSLHQIIPQFKVKNSVQKVQCVILTDGEAAPLPFHVEVRRYEDGDVLIGNRRVKTAFLRNRKTGITRKIEMDSYYAYNQFTDVLLRDLRDTFTDVNFIGIRVLAPRDAANFIRLNTSNDSYFDVMDVWKKERSFSLDETGYHRYFGMSSAALSSETDFVVSNDATKSAIRNAFKKSLKSKKMNKKFLNEFIKLVA